jgi:hypothetical protein
MSSWLLSLIFREKHTNWTFLFFLTIRRLPWLK